MSQLDNHHIAPTASIIVNPSAGGLELSQSRADSISKAYAEHTEDVEKVSEVRDVNTKADQFGTNTEYSKEERTLLRKLDWHIMPIVFCMYFMNKLDQNAIANARLNSFEKDLGLTGNQFNICVSVLYAGYTLIQVSYSTYCATGGTKHLRLTKSDSLKHVDGDQENSTLPLDGLLDDVSLKVSSPLYLVEANFQRPLIFRAWAIVSASTAAVQNFSGAFAVRFLLGFAEAPFYPGAIYMLSLFYTRREIATRISILYSKSVILEVLSDHGAKDKRCQHYRDCLRRLDQCCDFRNSRRCPRTGGLEMALHHPGCCHVRYFHRCDLAPSGSPAHDSLALTRGARTRSFPNGARHRRPRGEQGHAYRTQAGRR